MAARGGLENQSYPWGNEVPTCNMDMITGTNFSGCNSNDAFPIMSFLPNGFGLYDMAGNVGEWVDNLGHVSGDGYFIRGGSWLSNSSQITIEAISYSSDGIHGYVDTGFRCARSAP